MRRVSFTRVAVTRSGSIKRRGTAVADVEPRRGSMLTARIGNVGSRLIKQRGDDTAVQHVRPALVTLLRNVECGDAAIVRAPRTPG